MATSRNHLADYDVGPAISKGSFGVVYKAVRKSDGRVFALKQVSLKDMTKVERQEAIDEARMLAQLNHPHVIKHYDSFIDVEDKLNILMEFASKGNLSTLIKSYHGKPMPEDAVWRVLIQSLLGLSHIHGKKIIHRDIKSLNLFIDAQDNIKIGDLGIARALSNHSDFARTIVGTPYYLSPELCEDKPYNVKSDIWALGVVLYECCMGRYPFDAQNEGALIRKILRGQFQPIQGPYSTTLMQLITSCLSFKPEARPDTQALLRNPSLQAKAKALNIDLNPRATSAMDDKPVYEAMPPTQQQGAGQQHPFQQNGGYPQQYANGGQAGQAPYPPQRRPGSAGPQGRTPQQQQQQQPYNSPQAAWPARPGDHPFALAGGPQQPPMQAYGQQQQSPYAQQPPRYTPQQQSPYAQQSPGYGQQVNYGGQQQPVSPGRDPYDPWDRLAVDVNKMQLRESEVARNNVVRAQQMQANIHAGQRDNLKDLMYGAAVDSGPKPQRLTPEALPAAGARPTSAHAGAPFATHYPGNAANQSMAQASMNEAWRATYQPPQYGRRRCPELQITGPSLRGTSARAGSGRAGYVPAADDATSYATTSHATSYYQ